MRNKLVIIHIPKTAGSTLRATVGRAVGKAHRGKYRIIGIDEPEPGPEYFVGLKAKAQRRVDELLNHGVQAMSGHYRYRDVQELVSPCRDQVSIVTFIRDPMWRTVSDYHYCLTDRHPWRDDFVQEFPSFETFLNTPREMNKQLKYLRPSGRSSVAEAIDCALENIDFIGLTEQFERDLETLMNSAGISYELQESRNVQSDREKMQETYERHYDQMQDILEPELEFHRAILEHRKLGAWPRETSSVAE
ncbi:MAG: sulfotransferase family 2 domain-containing protein [Pseudomonadota bacterium]